MALPGDTRCVEVQAVLTTLVLSVSVRKRGAWCTAAASRRHPSRTKCEPYLLPGRWRLVVVGCGGRGGGGVSSAPFAPAARDQRSRPSWGSGGRRPRTARGGRTNGARPPWRSATLASGDDSCLIPLPPRPPSPSPSFPPSLSLCHSLPPTHPRPNRIFGVCLVCVIYWSVFECISDIGLYCL